MLDRLAAEVGRIDFLARLDDRAAHRACMREEIEQLVAIAPTDRALQRSEIFGNRASISRIASLLCKQTSRHMVGSDAARRVKSRKPEAEYLITSDFVTVSRSSAVPTML